MIKLCNVEEPTLLPGEHENTDDTVITLFGAANVTLSKEEISISHRLPGKESARLNKPAAILLKCDLRNTRNKLIRQKKALRENQDFKRKYPDAFIVEHLTPMRSKVAYMLRNDDTIAKTWTIDGRIKVVKSDALPTDKPITIDSLMQLTKLGWSMKKIENLIFED